MKKAGDVWEQELARGKKRRRREEEEARGRTRGRDERRLGNGAGGATPADPQRGREPQNEELEDNTGVNKRPRERC